MRLKGFAVVFLCLCMILAIGCTERTEGAAENFSQVTTANGIVEGVNQDEIVVFQGIPFAEPPVGDLRFAPPKAVKSWNNVLDCTEPKPVPPQITDDNNLIMDEDCLYLNIWASEDTLKNAKKKETPVLVFIHGGAFATGYATKDMYNGTSLAKKGIICVTVEYRLNATGFLASKEMEDEHGYIGNLGLLDQIESLKWIQKNIEHFGGDPKNITISGESAGSMSVSSLILSPMAKGLFQKAIMESGSLFGQPIITPDSNGNMAQGLENGKKFMKTIGANNIEDLRNADINDLVKNSAFSMNVTTPSPYYSMPILDGKVVDASPYESLKNGAYNDVKIMTGYNTDEGTMFVPQGLKESEYKDFVKRIFKENAAAYLERFPVDDTHNPTDRARDLVRYSFQLGCHIFGDALSEQGKDVYLYNFDYHIPAFDQIGMGVSHGLELPFVFDSFNTDIGLPEDGESFIDQIQNYWLSFVQDGNPNSNGKNTVKWPKYTEKTEEILKMNSQTQSVPIQDKEDISFITELFW